jgi:hypothetical protein
VHATTVDEELHAMAPAAKSSWLKRIDNDVNKLTKKEIVSLLLTCFAVNEDANKKHTGDLVALLSREIEAHPHRML